MPRNKEWDKARAEYLWVLEHHRAVEARVGFARMLEQLGDFDLASELLLSNAELEPETERARYLPRATVLWWRRFAALDAEARAHAIAADWAQGARGQALRLQSLLAKADDELLHAIRQSFRDEEDATRGPREPAVRQARVAIARIAATASAVERVPPPWRIALARWVAAELGPLAFLWRGAPPALRRCRELGFRLLAEVLAQSFLRDRRHPTDVLRWETMETRVAPRPRQAHAFAADPSNQQLVIYGGNPGENEVLARDSWRLDDQGWTQITSIIDPGPRTGAALAHDGDGFLVFGGAENVVGAWTLATADTWRLTPSSGGWQWTRLGGADERAPMARAAHAMVFDRQRGVVVLFGGMHKNGIAWNDTWEWSPRSGTWRCVQAHNRDAVDRPRPAAGASMVYDPLRNETLLFVGLGRSPERYRWHHAMWSWSGERWTRVGESLELPPARAHAAFFFHPTRHTCLLYGGVSPLGKVLTDCWEWDGAEWRELEGRYAADDADWEHEPPPRGSPAVGCLADGRLVLFGGSQGRQYSRETWVGRVGAR